MAIVKSGKSVRKNVMKKTISFDIHGVIDKHPLFFRFVLYILSRFFNVVIITGPPKIQAFNELAKLGFKVKVHYSKIFSIVDFLKDRKTNMWKDDKDTWWTYDNDWWASKGTIARENNIILHVDDQLRYETYFPKSCRFILWKL